MSGFTHEVQIDKPNNTKQSKENANGNGKKQKPKNKRPQTISYTLSPFHRVHFDLCDHNLFPALNDIELKS